MGYYCGKVNRKADRRWARYTSTPRVVQRFGKHFKQNHFVLYPSLHNRQTRRIFCLFLLLFFLEVPQFLSCQSIGHLPDSHTPAHSHHTHNCVHTSMQHMLLRTYLRIEKIFHILTSFDAVSGLFKFQTEEVNYTVSLFHSSHINVTKMTKQKVTLWHSTYLRMEKILPISEPTTHITSRLRNSLLSYRTRLWK